MRGLGKHALPFPFFFLETNSSFFSHLSAKKALKEEEKNPEDNIDSEKTLFFRISVFILAFHAEVEGGFAKQRRRGVVTAPFPFFPPPGDAVLIYIFIIGTLRSGGGRKRKKKRGYGEKSVVAPSNAPASSSSSC